MVIRAPIAVCTFKEQCVNFPRALTAFLLTAFSSCIVVSPSKAADARVTNKQTGSQQPNIQQVSTKQIGAQQIAFFNSGQLQQAAQSGYGILRRDPTNSVARYYYAQTLFKLNRIEDAKSQFAECYKSSKDATMKSHCYQALKTLAAHSPGQISGAQANASDSSPSTSAPSTGSSSSSTSKDEVATSDPALMSRKLQIMNDGSANIEAKRRQMLADIQKAKDRAAEAMHGIEPVLQRPIWTSNRPVRWEQYENPEYTKELERSQRELKIKTEELTDEFNRREAEILADCKTRAALYDQVSSGLKSQQKIGNSQIQLTPQHSNGFVRHYVNYDGSAPVSLKARQGELSNTKAATGSGSSSKSGKH